MASIPAIKLENVTKTFEIFGSGGERKTTLRESLLERAGFKAKAMAPESARFYTAISEVSLSIAPGERVVVVGKNGAGKSTLLRLMAGLTRPSSGQVVTKGRIACLFGLGNGIDSTLSGRENVYLYGALVGLRRREITEKFDRIVDFSGVGDFIDVPVKYYSSGMTARLAFSVATEVRPDILMLDEVLAVGDVDFQVRCLERMREVMRQGCAVVIVSHAGDQILEFCERGLLLDRGRIVHDGALAKVLKSYHGQKKVPFGHGEGPIVEGTSV